MTSLSGQSRPPNVLALSQTSGSCSNDAASRAARSLSASSIHDIRVGGAGCYDAAAAATGRGTDVAAGDKKAVPGIPGGYKAITAFILSLVAYTLQTEFAQHVQQTLNYKKPFFSLYIGHSSFIVILPLHLLLLKFTTGCSIRKHYWHLIVENLRWQTESRTIRSSLLQGGQEDSGLSLPSPIQHEVVAESTLWRIRSSFNGWCGFDAFRILSILALLTIGITVPALSWYAAVPLTSMADITALYNCFAVSALVFSVWFLGDRWQAYKVVSVLLAVGGVIVVSYGGAEHKKAPRLLDPVKGKPDTAAVAELPHPFVGDMLALLGAVTMGLYEIVFKLVGTLPDEELQLQLYGKGGALAGGHRRSRGHQSSIEYRPVNAADGLSRHEDQAEGNALSGDTNYQATGTSPSQSRSTSSRSSFDGDEDTEKQAKQAGSNKNSSGPTTYSREADDFSSESESELDEAELAQLSTGGTTRLSRTSSRTRLKQHSAFSTPMHTNGRKRLLDDVPPPLPWGMHSNIMTSGIGLVTALSLWLGVVIAHFAGWEPFEWPYNFATVASLAIVAICGVFFNACFMILLSIWGPVLASVSCLLTTVLVEIADVLLGRQLKVLSLIGCIFIGCGFVVLIFGESRARHVQ
ncbi:hypothetical protein K437DRAFT_231800 [Tilletiaria anomala UBC 951]|uniref:EamA domain-containing protein n=1 Tax=Tilletiaria anomala (strain ATCC 24038 / CBS 436.72 / UBC 951) TaxID=1037660 RepID=A0A066WFY6_TILAU|nr:uncharacterized protein K437DRAFT_231800 [Tilletiaria anomala UBC 951]KDN52711.1 hypothetical protein K437DRAFT_231800 [Tilletiaria anomala UBC 951]